MNKDEIKQLYKNLAKRDIKIRVRIRGEESLITPEEPPCPEWLDKKKSPSELQLMYDSNPIQVVAELMTIVQPPTHDNESFIGLLKNAGATKDSIYNGAPLWHWAVKWLNPTALAILFGKNVHCKMESIPIEVLTGIIFKKREIVSVKYPELFEIN